MMKELFILSLLLFGNGSFSQVPDGSSVVAKSKQTCAERGKRESSAIENCAANYIARSRTVSSWDKEA